MYNVTGLGGEQFKDRIAEAEGYTHISALRIGSNP